MAQLKGKITGDIPDPSSNVSSLLPFVSRIVLQTEDGRTFGTRHDYKWEKGRMTFANLILEVSDEIVLLENKEKSEYLCWEWCSGLILDR